MAEAGEAYPVADGPFDEPALIAIDGDRHLELDNWTLLEPFADGDLYLSVMKGAAGLGDPLSARPRRSGATSTRATCCRASPSRSTRSPTATRARARRLERARPRAEWWAEQRRRVLDGDLIDPVKVAYAESMKLSERWAAEFRGSGTCPRTSSSRSRPRPSPPRCGRSPAGSARRSRRPVPRASEVAEAEPPRAAGGRSSRDACRALDERLSRAEVKEIQSAYKDPDRFEKWIEVLQERVPYGDRIVLPSGRASTWSAARTTASW